ncbi:unnamed protein product, partial [Didymodactylos carnosus]
MRARAMRSPAP